MALVKKRKLSDFVVEEIKRMIQTGELKEGDKLPDQIEFSKQLGVSRTALREAFTTLTNLGVLEKRQKFGTIIKSNFLAIDKEYTDLPNIDDKKTTLELIEARKLVEVGVAALAAQKATTEQIEEMGILIANMTKALVEQKTNEYSKIESDFHFMMAKATQNRIVEYIYKTFLGIMKQFMRESFITLSVLQDNSLEFHESHCKIFEAIQNRDPDEASSLMKRHLLESEKYLERYYKALGKLSKDLKTKNT